MRKLQLALVFCLSIVILFVVVLFSAPTFINWQNNKGIIENVFSEYLGYRVRVNGDLQVQLLPNPKIYAEDLVVDSVTGDQSLIEVEHIILTKSLSDLMALDFSIDELIINRPKLNLVKDEDGSRNWEPLKVKSSNYYSRKLKNILTGLVNFKSINIENAGILYTDIATAETKDITNIYLKMHAENQNALNISSEGVYKGLEQKLSLKLDISNPKGMRVDSTLASTDHSIALQGILNNPYSLYRSQFVGKVSADFADGNKINFDNTFFKLKSKYFDLKDLHIDSEFSVSKNKLTLSTINLSSLFNKLNGNLSIEKKKEKLNVAVKLDIEKIYVKKDMDVPVKATSMAWSDDLLDFSLVNGLVLNTSISCMECTYGDKKFYQVDLRANLENNNLIVNQFNLKANEDGFIKFTANAGLNSPASFEIKAEAVDFPLYTLLPKRFVKKSVFNIEGNTSFAASGVSPKALISNLTGTFNVDLEDVKLRNIDDSSINATVKGLLYGKPKTDFDTEIKKVVLNGSLRDGVFRSSDISFNLSGDDIVSKGKFDLANLTMNYRVEPVELKRNHLGLVVSGNLNDLEIISDKVTPKGVVDGFGRLVTTNITKKVKRRDVNTPFDFNDKGSLDENVRKYLFETR